MFAELFLAFKFYAVIIASIYAAQYPLKLTLTYFSDRKSR